MAKKMNNNSRRSGLGLISSVTLILIVLKLFKLISISWFMVFSPLWISLLIVVIAFFVILTIGRMKKGKW